ncbi:hypothetical protein [Actinacidiphila sp. ITFR-21]|uniref:hypothetical protein n=1 Tax=Actinacidiphila sp. ITFR-21 TaxID=3075199 RepID=UPI002889424F|nr:hypothetical protein [Streptomyces sp. ITFR-21]WNI16625.1 hypothetical protein RLT57_14635 [Streptomyces sp. ITFR-21]
MTRLPAGGRKGRIPTWPLIDDVRKAAQLDVTEGVVARLLAELGDPELYGAARASKERKLAAAELEVAVLTRQIAAQRGLETTLWREVWRTPQAFAWERLSWNREIAQYVRWKVLAELGDMDASKEARQLSDRLGLTPLALLRLRWDVVPDEELAERQRPQPVAPPAPAAQQPADPRSILHAV